MGSKNKKEKTNSEFLFGKRNYKIMLVGLGLIAFGFALMAGGGSDDPTIFNEEIYNFQRIRLAPTLILIGFAIEVYAILAKSEK